VLAATVQTMVVTIVEITVMSIMVNVGQRVLVTVAVRTVVKFTSLTRMVNGVLKTVNGVVCKRIVNHIPKLLRAVKELKVIHAVPSLVIQLRPTKMEVGVLKTMTGV